MIPATASTTTTAALSTSSSLAQQRYHNEVFASFDHTSEPAEKKRRREFQEHMDSLFVSDIGFKAIDATESVTARENHDISMNVDNITTFDEHWIQTTGQQQQQQESLLMMNWGDVVSELAIIRAIRTAGLFQSFESELIAVIDATNTDAKDKKTMNSTESTDCSAPTTTSSSAFWNCHNTSGNDNSSNNRNNSCSSSNQSKGLFTDAYFVNYWLQYGRHMVAEDASASGSASARDSVATDDMVSTELRNLVTTT